MLCIVDRDRCAPAFCSWREKTERVAPLSRTFMEKIVAYYEGKTGAILRRYGPGPRVHYHTGFIDKPPASGASAQLLRQHLIDAQERTLRYAAGVWRACSTSVRGRSRRRLRAGRRRYLLGSGIWRQCYGGDNRAFSCQTCGKIRSSRPELSSRVRPLLSDALVVPGRKLL